MKTYISNDARGIRPLASEPEPTGILTIVRESEDTDAQFEDACLRAEVHRDAVTRDDVVAGQVPSPLLADRLRPGAASFLRAVHPGTDGFLELRAFSSERRGPAVTRFVKLPLTDERIAEVQEFARDHGRLNVYHAIATRRTAGDGRLANCSELSALYAEFDLKRGVPLSALWNRITAFVLRPSAIVHSGGGLHVYWWLAAPLNLQNDADLARAYYWNGEIVRRLGGETESIEPARVLRVPHTFNFKASYGSRPPVVSLLQFPAAGRYTLANVGKALGDADPKNAAAPADAGSQPPVNHGVHDAAQRVRMAKAWLADQPAAIEGEGGDLRTHQACCSVAVGHDLDEDRALEALAEWNARCEPPWEERELRQKIRGAIRNAKEARGAKLVEFPTTEAGDAEFFAERHGDRIRFDHCRAMWLIAGTHGHWLPDVSEQPKQLMLDTMRARQRQAMLLDGDRKKSLMRWALDGESRRRIDNALALARSKAPIADPGDGWDTDPWLLGVRNGVVDLRTGTLRPCLPSDRVTKVTPVAFDPDARCPRWERFLREVFDDNPEVAPYMRRCLGYALTGVTTEQVFWILHGVGANGKSTLIETFVRHVLGLSDYSWTMPFPAAGWSNAMSEYQKAALVGRRLVMASEVTRRGELNDELIKSLTGDDSINARHPYGKPFQFIPAAKFFLRVNDRPRIRDQSHGMWRRVKAVPFNQKFKIDNTLGAALAAEAAGILAWTVKGCLEWQRDGLQHPDAVEADTKSYEQESDPLSEFFEERCEIGDGKKVGGRELFVAYCEWCDARQLQPADRLNQKTFGLKIKQRFQDVGTRTVVYSGIGLLTRNGI